MCLDVVRYLDKCIGQEAAALKRRDDVHTTFSENLIFYRKVYRLTQTELGELAGVHRTYISEIESGRCSPSLEIIGKLADALKVHPWELLYRHEVRQNPQSCRNGLSFY